MQQLPVVVCRHVELQNQSKLVRSWQCLGKLLVAWHRNLGGCAHRPHFLEDEVGLLDPVLLRIANAFWWIASRFALDAPVLEREVELVDSFQAHVLVHLAVARPRTLSVPLEVHGGDLARFFVLALESRVRMAHLQAQAREDAYYQSNGHIFLQRSPILNS